MKKQQRADRLVFVEDIVHQSNQHITQAHQGIIKDVIHEAQTYASKNLPVADEIVIEPYVTTFIGKYSALKQEISVIMQGALQKFYGSVGIAPMNEKIEAIKNAITQQSNTIANLETDKSRLGINTSPFTHKRHAWLLPVFGLAESLLMVSCFLKLGDIVIIAIIVGIVIGLAQIYAAKTTTLQIREVSDPRKRKLYYRLAILSFAIFSVVLGAIRSYYAHAGSAAGVPFIILNPFTFACLNMLLIIAASLVVHFYYPTKAQMQEQEQVEDINRQIKKCISRKRELEAQYEHQVEERVQAIKINGALAHNQKELFKRINSLFLEAQGMFIHQNVIKRTDGVFPACFKHPTRLNDNDASDDTFLLTNK